MLAADLPDQMGVTVSLADIDHFGEAEAASLTHINTPRLVVRMLTGWHKRGLLMTSPDQITKLYKQASKCLIYENDLVTALEIFQEIIALAPASPEAANSKARIQKIKTNRLFTQQCEKNEKKKQEAEAANKLKI